MQIKIPWRIVYPAQSGTSERCAREFVSNDILASSKSMEPACIWVYSPAFLDLSIWRWRQYRTTHTSRSMHDNRSVYWYAWSSVGSSVIYRFQMKPRTLTTRKLPSTSQAPKMISEVSLHDCQWFWLDRRTSSSIIENNLFPSLEPIWWREIISKAGIS